MNKASVNDCENVINLIQNEPSIGDTALNSTEEQSLMHSLYLLFCFKVTFLGQISHATSVSDFVSDMSQTSLRLVRRPDFVADQVADTWRGQVLSYPSGGV